MEYIHHCTYVHADLKGANILLGYGKDGDSQAYLVDFGLASHYTTKDFKPDPKKMHNGTIEYTSRDAHNGVPTMRGDLEILAYNLLHWLGGKFPWEKCLDKPPKVQELKEEFMKDVVKSIKASCSDIPSSVTQFFKYVADMSYDTNPDYKKLRKYFEVDIKCLGKSNTGKLEFGTAGNTSIKKSPKKSIKETPAKNKIKSEKSTPVRKRIQEHISIDDGNLSDDEKEAPKKSPAKKISTPNKRVIKNVTSPKKPSPKKLISTPKNDIIVNNNIKSQGKAKRTYELNVELDVSMDAKVIVNVNRKRKSGGAKENANSNESQSPSHEAKKARAAPKVSVRSSTKVNKK